MLHGEAVGIGMVLEARLGEAVGVTAKGTAARIVGLPEQFRLPVRETRWRERRSADRGDARR